MGKIVTILACIMVAGVVLGASLPIFDSITGSSESVHNDGAGWVRFVLDRNANTEYSVSITFDDEGFYVTNGTDVQSVSDLSDNFTTILYADSNLSVWVDENSIKILGLSDGSPVYEETVDTVSITRAAEGVTVQIGDLIGDSMTYDSPSWAYIPVSTGSYGFFYAADFDSDLGNGVTNYPSDMPLAAVGGGFAGVYAYNDIYTYDGLGLYCHSIYDDDGLYYGAYWDTTPEVPLDEMDDLNIDPFNPDDIIFNPIDLDPIDLDPGMQLLSVPTPTYSDGDWGYDTTTVDGVTKAVIVSYSGAGGNVTVPATIGGYDVYRFGKLVATSTSGTSQVMDNNSISSNTTVTFSEGIVEIGRTALQGCSKVSGVTLADSIVSLGGACFTGTGITTLNLGASLTNLYNSPFQLNSNMTSITVSSSNQHYTTVDGILYDLDQTQLVYYPANRTGAFTIPSTVNTIKSAAFAYCNNTMALKIPDSVTTLEENAFYYAKFTTIELSKNITEIPKSCFNHASLTNIVAIPNGVTTIGGQAFQYANCSGYVIPSTVESIANNAVFGNNTYSKVFIFASDYNCIPSNSALGGQNNLEYILDLSETYDFSNERYGLSNDAELSDNIGECFGFISVVDISGGDAGVVSTLISILPLLMAVGLVLVAIGMFVWNRM